MNFEELTLADICFSGRTSATGWTLGLAITVPLLVTLVLYGVGALRVWRRSREGRVLRLRQALLFLAGWATMAVALMTPLHAAGERLFAAHMAEHELLMAVAAPLLVLSRPLGAMFWAFSPAWRQRLATPAHSPRLRRLWSFATDPLVATVIHGVAIWAWHVPGLFQAALAQGVLHWLQHASFFGSALLFWWAMLGAGARTRQYGASVMHLFLTSLHTSLLGVLLAVSPRLWYPANASDAFAWGLTPLEDQQLAGVIMWVPAGLIYAGAALAVACLWIVQSRKADISYREGDGVVAR